MEQPQLTQTPKYVTDYMEGKIKLEAYVEAFTIDLVKKGLSVSEAARLVQIEVRRILRTGTGEEA